MKNIKSKLQEIIVTRPDVIQFAKDRKYEEAWIIDLSNPQPTESQIKQYLEREKFNIIIVEYIWNSKDDDNRFVLTLFLDEHCELKNSNDFVSISFDLFYHYSDFSGFLSRLDAEVVGSKYLLLNQPDAINLGVFNHWLSVGPVDLWQEGEVYKPDEVGAKITARPDISRTVLNYQGLLFRFNSRGNHNGPYYGIKTPCCHKINDGWVIDFEKVDNWIKLMLDL